MPIQRPPQTDDDAIAAWAFEATEKIEELEQRLFSLLQFIKSNSYSDLQEKVKTL